MELRNPDAVDASPPLDLSPVYVTDIAAPTRVAAAKPLAATRPQVLDLQTALEKLQEAFFCCCTGYPADSVLEAKLRPRVAAIEASLSPREQRRWRAERDCLLARLGFHPLAG